MKPSDKQPDNKKTTLKIRTNLRAGDVYMHSLRGSNN